MSSALQEVFDSPMVKEEYNKITGTYAYDYTIGGIVKLLTSGVEIN